MTSPLYTTIDLQVFLVIVINIIIISVYTDLK